MNAASGAQVLHKSRVESSGFTRALMQQSHQQSQQQCSIVEEKQRRSHWKVAMVDFLDFVIYPGACAPYLFSIYLGILSSRAGNDKNGNNFVHLFMAFYDLFAVVVA
jgi:hypothetical protein